MVVGLPYTCIVRLATAIICRIVMCGGQGMKAL